MHPLAALVKRAIETYIKTGKVIEAPAELSEEMTWSAGVFVCLKTGGQLRGCIGTIEPAAGCVAEEAIRNAIASATEDPRFFPLGEHELKDIDVSVDVLCPAEKVSSISELDPKRYGVIVKKGPRRGLLLPDIEGVDSPQEQVRIAKTKAGLDPADPDVELFRFKVQRFE